MWNKFFKVDKEAAIREVAEEKRNALKNEAKDFAKWYAGVYDEEFLEKVSPYTSKAGPGGWVISGSAPAGPVPRPPTPTPKFDFSAWEFNVACIKLAEKLGFTTAAEIYAFIKEIERD